MLYLRYVRVSRFLGSFLKIMVVTDTIFFFLIYFLVFGYTTEHMGF